MTTSILPQRLAAFLSALAASGYRGDIASDIATRAVFATDNSIYQLLPAAVLYPREGEDLNHIVRLAASAEYGPIPLAPRGGGTGTNGQSLSSGVVVDTSRHMNGIVSFDAERRLVTVQPGVVLDQLNAYLKPHGLFFPPNVSTATRATLGGMVATDASGKGSRIYGKTSDYIEAMDIVLADGSDWSVADIDDNTSATVAARTDMAGAIHREVRRVVTQQRERIAAIFPKMNRGLTGYNLQHVRGTDGAFRLAYLLAGSEGTLALTKQITLRVIARPSHRALVAVRYAHFQMALADVQRLVAAEPAAIEILDDKVLGLAQQDVIWSGIENVLGGTTAQPVLGLNFVEFVGDSAAAVQEQVARLEALLADGSERALDWAVVTDASTVAQLWTLREKAVGLLGRLGGARQGTAFVEDTAVPPEKLADYVAEFRALLDSHGLAYGMFGHADVGCLHVRPLLDMKNPFDAALIRPISDGVAALTKKYGGLLWGEHGRGFRGEYSPFFFGPELYAELCRIKAVFDPQNIFNPGKLATPGPQTALHKIDRIDMVPLRGQADHQIDAVRMQAVERAVACNGNGACFSWDASDPMCPSYKATRDRTQSPKGRATLLREWARLDSVQQAAPSEAGATALQAMETELKTSLSTCLSCKACASQCPVRVDIPAMKSRFLQHYHQRVPRSRRDRLVARMEPLLALASKAPALANLLSQNRVTGAILRKMFGLSDLPALSTRPVQGKGDKLHPSQPQALQKLAVLPSDEKPRHVILLEDSFTSSFDTSAAQAVHDVLTLLGYRVHLASATANGKSLHVLGMLDQFAPVAETARSWHGQLAATGLPLLGVEAVTMLMHEHEYKVDGKVAGAAETQVQSVDQFLSTELEAGRLHWPQSTPAAASAPFRLFLHCTEKTARPRTGSQWSKVFHAAGLQTEVQATGCCGMAGLFGHEQEHVAMSSQLFDLSWAPKLAGAAPAQVLASGFSCRCQTERQAGFRPRHPAEALLAQLRAAGCS
ncbi:MULTISPECIES: FAD-binding and (Fe-S)-binding domain-containing protein [unclassified Janthinobacterium]|uniref:FAD-binding and (Fe-S)-binding domain-containing protein n=1 Tax=unclassified Janthinobacterium TaxID=2610881 RepID=UPI0016148E64|nr:MULTISPECIES: FAD-binding and (Fe-S)-binding domain-containing protein [unclassified Janthinobacterium]MBB5608045.1 FAD/FMN-containing dehydrogenase/Fe-S oxidoreductase [Janthinobacterium sp. S3T4]MBB5613214.1 FAD/FMN-containing dehydrogenase/Fe-S oxidoreductase [Janthinobacterium sp. S3M3]